ncbi:protein kinase family protein, partial [Glycomyces sp. NPDC021274]
MAERSTAAVDVADTSGEESLTAKAGRATDDGAQAEKVSGKEQDAARTEGKGAEATDPKPPELHSGHKLARRYRLEECVTRLDGFSSWRAVDEKLRRAVGVHVLPADHPRARPVLSAARASALLGDPRFVQVLDAVEDNDLVYVVHEWLPDATELATVLANGPLEPHDAYQLVSQVSQAMAAAHREGLSHLRLTPSSVLRTESGQYRIRGLAVMAALRGITCEHPQRTDTEAIGALLYAALTQRWPYENDAYGLTGLPKGVGLIAPDQVRAGVHRGLSELAMRALVNDGATASRQEPPCTTPEELAKAVAAMPRI